MGSAKNKQTNKQTPYAIYEQQVLHKPVVPKVLDLICYWFLMYSPFQKYKMGAKFYQFKMIHDIDLVLDY